MQRLEKVEYQGFIIHATAEARRIVASGLGGKEADGLVPDEMTEKTPFAAMAVSWLLLDQEADRIVKHLHLQERPREGAANLAIQLARETPGQKQLQVAGATMTLLRVFQEAERHPTEVTPDVALSYSQSARQIRDYFRELVPSSTPPPR